MPFKLFPFSDGAKQLHTVHIMRLHSVSHQGLARLEEAEAEAEEDGEVTILVCNKALGPECPVESCPKHP